jgi:hypothetical protein
MPSFLRSLVTLRPRGCPSISIDEALWASAVVVESSPEPLGSLDEFALLAFKYP